MKEFLKPTIGKIVLTIIIFLFLGYLRSINITDVRILGFPLIYYEKGLMPCPPSILNCNRADFNYFNLIIDIIFAYLISSLIIYSYNKIKKKI